ncbi:MAG: hypothetical protein E7081_00340 [Bacteroidales bacterium]|nr:hypothetical protein [Bacteroidales bacterium]
MKKMVLCFVVAVTSLTLQAQFKVKSLQQVHTGAMEKAYHPRFMPDGNLLVSAENYTGLGIVNVKSGVYTELTDMCSAGYYPVIANDGKTIIVRQKNDDYTVDIYSINVADKSISTVATQLPHLNQLGLCNNKVSYAVNSKVMTAEVTNSSTSQKFNPKDNIFVTEEDLKIVVYNNGRRIVLDPLKGQIDWGETQYVWTSLSPNKDKILFSCADNAYICDINGKNLVKVGPLRAPVWRGNTHVVGMHDKDDGYFYTESNIVIAKADGTQYQQLTPATSEIKMFPAVSNDGNKIAFHTLEGKIYLMTIEEE